jgi:hypothetical protein
MGERVNLREQTLRIRRSSVLEGVVSFITGRMIVADSKRSTDK